VSGTLILLYHRIAQPVADPFGLAVAPERFREHVEHLAHTRAVVPLRDVARGARASRIAITFDDGYADNAEVAAPLVAAAGLPVTWFVTVGRLGGHRFWWDRLTHALLGPHPLQDALDVEMPGGPVWLDLRARDARVRALNLLHHRIRPAPPDEVEALVDHVAVSLQVPDPPLDARTMSVNQLRNMASVSGAEIGAHTLSHLQLRGQCEAVRRREVLGSVQRLTEIVGRPVKTFAYPYGSPRAVDVGAQRLVREAGCELACSTDVGVARPGRRRFRLPRVAVGNWSGEEFAARISAMVNRNGYR